MNDWEEWREKVKDIRAGYFTNDDDDDLNTYIDIFN